MKKKILAVLLAISALFGLFSCSKDENTYPPVESTKEERKTVMTLSIDEEKYEIPYELYRAFFLQYKSSVDGGDPSVWQSESKNSYIEKIDSMIITKISSIYSVLHLCKKTGTDPYSKEFDEAVAEYIAISVEGGSVGNTILEGHGGDYDKYLLSLKEMNLNYSVADLLIRYALAQERIEIYYAGDADNNDPEKAEGKIKYTRDDVMAFYNGSESARIIRAFFAKEAFTETRVEQIRDKIALKSNEDEVSNYVIQFSLSGGEDIKNGEVLGKYSLDPAYYSSITDEAFALSVGQTGQVIELITDNENGYTVIYRAAKSDEHFNKCYDSIAAVYVENEIGKLLNSAQTALAESAEYADLLRTLDRASISMD